MFHGILKIRVGWVLEAIKMYVKMFPNENQSRAMQTIECYSPYEVRQLLQQVFTVSEWAQEREYAENETDVL